LRYDSKEELDDAFFNNVPKVDLIDLIMFIGDHADMWGAFTHMKVSFR
jgi:hypothetical protein